MKIGTRSTGCRLRDAWTRSFEFMARLQRKKDLSWETVSQREVATNTKGRQNRLGCSLRKGSRPSAHTQKRKGEKTMRTTTRCWSPFLALLFLAILFPSSRGTAGQQGRSFPGETEEDALFREMAPWVFVKHHQSAGEHFARFLNTNTNRKTPWMQTGQALAGATIVRIDRDSAYVRKGKATQRLLYVSETPLPRKKSSLRTPEETVRAQRRYSEFYMKKFIVSGKEYTRKRGRKTDAPAASARD